jgi:predicted transcriptional regulator
MSDLPSVKDFMDKTYVTLNESMDVYKAIDILLEKGVTSAVVVDDDGKICGILSEKDCMTLLTKGEYHTLPSGKVCDYMTEHVVTIPPNLDIFHVAELFLKHFFRRLVVADEENHMIGQITRRDLLRVIKKFRTQEKAQEKKIAPIL